MDTLLTISDFVGRFHPVLVHLPVGILLLAVFFYFLSRKQRYHALEPAVAMSLLVGTIAGLFSCITGYLLSQSGDYDEGLLSKHQWFGIGLTIMSGIAYYSAYKKHQYLKWLLLLLAVLISITGHLGGTITHGEGYLTSALNNDADNSAAVKPIANVQEAMAYSDIVRPILKSKCYSCHAAAKQKGRLRLDEPSYILKGGKGGEVVVAGSAGESEMIHRILLAKDNEDHMPPKQKPQLTSQEKELLSWWVNTGADFNKKVAALEQPQKIKACLAALQSGNKDGPVLLSDIPVKEVEKADQHIIEKLKAMNVSVSAVSQTSNYLSVNLVAADTVTNELWSLLKKIEAQLIWIKASNKKISDTGLKAIGELSALTRLSLENTSITDAGLVHLNKLTQLQYLNLSSTGITGKGLSLVNGLKNLKQLFLYKSAVNAEDFSSVKKYFPAAAIDTGGYQLAFLATDTMIVKAKKVK